jgi:hypothetical protein
MLGKRILLAAIAASMLGGAALAAEPEVETLKTVSEPLVHVAVADAPGDGETALAAALAKRLAAAGLKEGSPHSSEIYLVEGVVELAPASRGRQSVRIDWRVYSPDGGTLGGVSQTKLVRRGSLDKSWGKAADAAASAAAQGIAKLIPH